MNNSILTNMYNTQELQHLEKNSHLLTSKEPSVEDLKLIEEENRSIDLEEVLNEINTENKTFYFSIDNYEDNNNNRNDTQPELSRRFQENNNHREHYFNLKSNLSPKQMRTCRRNAKAKVQENKQLDIYLTLQSELLDTDPSKAKDIQEKIQLKVKEKQIEMQMIALELAA